MSAPRLKPETGWRDRIIMILDFQKLSFICELARASNKSNLKQFIMAQHAYRRLTSEEVATLFAMYELAAA